MTLGPISDGENIYSEGYYIQWLKSREQMQNDTFLCLVNFLMQKQVR